MSILMIESEGENAYVINEIRQGNRWDRVAPHWLAPKRTQRWSETWKWVASRQFRFLISEIKSIIQHLKPESRLVKPDPCY